MNANASEIVAALLELSKNAPHGDKLLREVRDLLSKHVRGTSGVPEVTLTTPTGHEPELAAAVAAALEKKYGSKPDVTEHKNPALIGGAVLQIGDEQIDLSVRGALNDLDMKLRTTSLSA